MTCNLGNPCDYCIGSSCPENLKPGDEKIVCYCYKCDKAILEGDTYYYVLDEPFCEECIANAEREA